MINNITPEEKRMIDICRFKYINNNMIDCDKDMCSIDKLLIPWGEAKSTYLYQLLGNNLIISKPIFYNKVTDEIELEIADLVLDNSFVREFTTFIDSKNKEFSYLRLLINSYYLAINEYEGFSFTITRPNGKTMKINKGCKPIKILQKIAKEFNIPYFEEFRLEHSRILNQKVLSGHLCLSIHPLDYITMSENNYNWTSCMSWFDEGEYRQGTVEMMNSSCVIVAYLKGKEDYTIEENYKWSNKKWRELFIVSKETLMEIKGYPYQNSDLSSIVLNWLKELAETNLNWHYSKDLYKYDSSEPRIYCKENHMDYKLRFHTSEMYNDFGSKHLCFLGFDINNHYLHLNYSGDSQCIICGEANIIISDPTFLTCSSCCHMIQCDCCEQWYSKDKIIYYNNEAYCSYCYEENFAYCAECNDEVYINDVYPIYLVDEDFEIIDELHLCKDCYNEFCSKYHDIIEVDGTRISISESNLNEELKNFF